MELVILSWFILAESNSPFILGIYGALRFGGTLIAPVIGLIADTVGRKKMLITVRISFLLNSIVGLSLSILGILNVWKILIMAAFLGLSKTSEMIVRQSLVPDILKKSQVKNGVALERAGSDLSQIFAPIIGGFLLSFSGMSVSYGMVAIFYATSTIASVMITIDPPEQFYTRRKNTRGINLLTNVFEGIKYVAKMPHLSSLMTLAVIINLTAFPLYFSLTAVVAKEILETTSGGLGILLGIYSAGAATGSIAMGANLYQEQKGRLLVIGSIIWHITVFLMALVNSENLAYPILFVSGFGQSVTVVLMASMILDMTPTELRGRIMGLRQLAVGALPFGLTISGLLAENVGIGTTLILNGIVGLVLIAVTLIIWPQLLHREKFL